MHTLLAQGVKLIPLIIIAGYTICAIASIAEQRGRGGREVILQAEISFYALLCGFGFFYLSVSGGIVALIFSIGSLLLTLSGIVAGNPANDTTN